jgi:dienelactone hydrolase
MGALDDWTPPAQCRAVIDRVTRGRDLVETRVYEGAHHSFDALGLPCECGCGVRHCGPPIRRTSPHC